MNPIRLGIVSFGVQGATYARLIDSGQVPNTVIGAIIDIDQVALSRAADVFPDVRRYSEYATMLASGDVDAVIITAPHYLHPQMAITALQAGIHVLVEKPAGVYTKQVAQLNAVAASRPELTFAMMFNQRNNPLYRRIKQIIAGGEIGRIRRSHWTISSWWRPQGYYEQSAWRGTWGGEGGGVLVNQAPHQLDLWQWICGMPKTVFAKVGYGFRRSIAVEDEATALVDYGDGATGTFITAVHDLVGTDRFEILADRGKIVVDGSKSATVTRFVQDERELSDSLEPEALRQFFTGEFDRTRYYSQEGLDFPQIPGQQHAGVLENFADHILHGTPLLAPGSDGMNGVRLANAIHLSSWLEREVPLDFDEDDYLHGLNDRIRAEGRFPPREELAA